MSQNTTKTLGAALPWLFSIGFATAVVVLLILARTTWFAQPPVQFGSPIASGPGQAPRLTGSVDEQPEPEPRTAAEGRRRSVPVEPVERPPRELEGTVVDPVSGRPVPHFKLFLLPASEGDIVAHAESHPSEGIVRHDREGRFRLRGLVPGRYSLLVDPTESGFKPAVLRGVSFPRDELLAIEVDGGTHVTGRVLDSLGQPVASVEVRLETDPLPTDGWSEFSMHTDAEGRFLFTLVPPGTYALSVPGDEGTTEHLSLEEGEAAERDVSLWSARTISVSVIDPDGRPVSDAEVRVWRRGGLYRRGVSDSEGRAEVRAMALGTFAVQVRLDGYRNASHTVNMVGNDEFLEVRLQRMPVARY